MFMVVVKDPRLLLKLPSGILVVLGVPKDYEHMST